MTILESGLRVILQEHSKDFTDSLLARGIDVEKQHWEHEAVEYNAKVGAEILAIYAQQEGTQYLRTILDGLQKRDYLSTMAYIYIMSECSHRLPPYWIIQHAIDERLLEEYCSCLEEMLPAYMAMLPADKEYSV